MDLSNLSFSDSLHSAAILTIVLAFAGYLVTFMNARLLARRRDKLKLVNKRSSEFYGPLYVASQAGQIAYKSMLKKQGKEKNDIVTEAELKDWDSVADHHLRAAQ